MRLSVSGAMNGPISVPLDWFSAADVHHFRRLLSSIFRSRCSAKSAPRVIQDHGMLRRTLVDSVLLEGTPQGHLRN